MGICIEPGACCNVASLILLVKQLLVITSYKEVDLFFQDSYEF